MYYYLSTLRDATTLRTTTMIECAECTPHPFSHAPTTITRKIVLADCRRREAALAGTPARIPCRRVLCRSEPRID